jgi:hypothetical protein
MPPQQALRNKSIIPGRITILPSKIRINQKGSYRLPTWSKPETCVTRIDGDKQERIRRLR